ncbi:MAG: TIGR00366 family protein [Oscillospiraceae bacterium]|nr:TIGR00366 family protein [Oscillospiraceae bacterium]
MSENTVAQSKGNIFWRISKRFQYAADRLIPDSLVFCLILTFVVFILSMIFTMTNPLEMIKYWYKGFWTQSTFAFQMTIMVVTCAAFAKSPAIEKLLDKFAGLAHSPRGAMIIFMIFSLIASFINWAFCVIVNPILAMRMAKQIKGLHFPMMIAAGYSCMILGQCMCPSASCYALLATPDHFLADLIGVLTQNVTTYNPMNVILWCILAIVTVIVSVLTTPPANELVEFKDTMAEVEKETTVAESNDTPADKMNNSRIIMYLIGVAGLIYIVWSFIANGVFGSLSLNFIIFLFIMLNCFVYSTPKKFIAAYKECMFLSTDIMIQFPFYGGIAGMMSDSGFASVIVSGIVSIASARSIPVWTYISACIVNLFIPSQGGQWIIQGPLMMPACIQLGGNIPDCINAFVYGDEATNLLQPLYLIPALAVVNGKLKEVWGYCAYIFVFWFIITCLGLYFIPEILA